ncbi:hypothetical protein GCM10027267_28340 [Paramicrobacterium agarici]
MMTYVTAGCPESLRMTLENRDAAADLTRGAEARCSRMHSGQITPTGACVWHSAQIVRPQRWQSTKL